MVSPSLEAHGIWKGYGTRLVLRGVDLSVAPGEIYGLLGPNGAGKSTAINILVGLLPADRGRVRIAGRPLCPSARAQIGYVPQAQALYLRLSCQETLRFFGRVHGVPRRELNARVEVAMASTGLEAYRTVRVEALSGGWRQRLNVAAGIVHDPALLVLDEPTTGLDVDVRYELWSLMASLADRGTAILLSSHSLQETEAHCHRVGILEGGRVVAEGPPQVLRHLVPARAVAEIDLDEAAGLTSRARDRGWDLRQRGGRWLRYLGEERTLPSVARELEGLPLRSLSVRPVSLEDVYLEVTRRHVAADP